MLFTSLEFFVFLPLTLVVFALIDARWRCAWLLLASWVFYGWGHPSYLVYLGAITIAVYGLGWTIERAAGGPRVALLIVGIMGLAGALITFKFYDFSAGEIERFVRAQGASLALPRLGITAPAGFSFYVFSALSYLIDVHQTRVSGKQRARDIALYLAFFSKILAGPIERAPTFLSQLGIRFCWDAAKIVLALQMIVWGLFKKVVIADNLGPVVDHDFAVAAFAAPLELLISVYFFAFQIYCDFSGYSDIAIGVALLFGIRLMDNFRRPYLSVSTSEFWGQRWHISLAHWFRDYLYIPLGGSRAGPVRRYANVMAVFMVSGMWHAGLGYGVGWTFLIWGALNGVYQWIELTAKSLWHRLGDPLPWLMQTGPVTVLRVVLTFHLVAVAWVFFRAKSTSDAWLILKKIGTHLTDLPGVIPRYPYTTEHAMGAVLIVLLLVIEIVDERKSMFTRLAAAPLVLRWTVYYLAIFGLLLLGRWQVREFIYMQF